MAATGAALLTGADCRKAPRKAPASFFDSARWPPSAEDRTKQVFTLGHIAPSPRTGCRAIPALQRHRAGPPSDQDPQFLAPIRPKFQGAAEQTVLVTINPHAFTSGTQKALFRLSRGTCYFPKCGREILTYASGEPLVDVQIAHIAAAEPGGSRFDPSMSDGDRRAVDNLILLCQAHHNLIDKVHPAEYPVEVLHQWKRDNEDPAVIAALRAASANESNLEAILMAIAVATAPMRETTVELTAAVRSGDRAFTSPVADFAEVFGPSTPFSDWGLTLVVTVRNSGRLDIVVESVALQWELAGIAAPAVLMPPADPQAHRLPHRVADGAAGHWPIDALHIRGNLEAMRRATIVAIRAVVDLSSGEQFESAPVLFMDLVKSGFGPG